MSGPIRGAHNAEEKFFFVSGNMLYRLNNNRVAIPIGVIPGTGRVSMAHNQVTGGNELIVVNGSAGYVYNTATDTFQKITDPGYPGASVVVFFDGYLVQVEPAGRYFFHSDLADALSYNTLDRTESEGDPDRIVTLAVSQDEVVVFNRTTTEFFRNSGQATGTLQSVGPIVDYGCAGRHTVVKMDNSLILLDNTGRLVRLDGYSFIPISTVPFEQAIAGLDWANAFAFAYESEGHKIYYITFPNGKTYGFDVTTRLFHRRESYGLDRWRVNTLTLWNRKWIAGDFQGPKLYELDWDYMLEGVSDPLVSRRITGVAHGNQNRVEIPYLELIFDTGQAQTVPGEFPVQPQGPTIEGDAPNSVIGAEYEFAYTVTEGDAPIATVEIVSGSLPPGWEMDNAGVITGTATEGGEFTWSVRVTDTNGLWDEVADEADILAEQWWGSYPTFFTEMIVSNDEAETWGTKLVNETAEMLVHYGPKQLGSKVMFAQDGVETTVAFLADAEFVSTALDVAQIEVQNYIAHLRYIDGIAFAISPENDQTSMYSVDDGVSWATCFDPAAGLANDVAKVGNVWVTHNATVSSHFYYSEDEIPTSWTEGQSAGGGHYVIASNGNVAVSFDNANTCRRTTNGTTWASITVPSHGVNGTNGGDCIAIGDVFLFSRVEGTPTTILRSDDAGLTWETVEVRTAFGSVRRFEQAESGRVIASLPSSSIICYSDDLGLTWTEVDTGKSGVKVAPVRLDA